MSEYMFGLGKGWLPKRAEKIAREHDAEVINHTDPQCSCGCGCAPFECVRSRRHWFTTQNLGAPFNATTAREVFAALKAAGVKGF